MTTRRDWDHEQLRAYARQVAARAPEFSPAQISTLRRLLWGAAGQPPVPAVPLRPAGPTHEEAAAPAA